MAERFEVGVDFGTTYSAVAYRRKNAGQEDYGFILPGEIAAIDGYPDEPPVNRRETSKREVPTEIWYGPSGNILWGYQITHKKKSGHQNRILGNGTLFNRFKLLLDSNYSTETASLDLQQKLSAVNRTATGIIADYLTRLLTHTKNSLCTRPDFTKDTLIDLAITIPATWSVNSNKMMLNAANEAIEKSHFPTDVGPRLISEPRAAAIYTCYTQKDMALHEDETFLVCDAGGGTVDLITYTVLEKHPLRLKETVKGQGGLCGSSFINKSFEDALLAQLVKKRNVIEYQIGNRLQRAVELAEIEFEGFFKRVFTGVETEPLYLSIPDLREHNIEATAENELEISKGDAVLNVEFTLGIFEPRIRGVWELIQKQIEMAKAAGKTISKILLVGGFSESYCLHRYLENHLKEYFQENRIPKLVTPSTPSFEIAVAGGAVLCLSMPLPPEFLRSSYAISQTEPFRPSIREGHKGAPRYKDRVDQKIYVPRCLLSLVKAGEPIPPEGLTIETPYPLTYTFDNQDQRWIISLDLFAAEGSDEIHDHYQHDHAKNSKCKRQGSIQFEILEEVKLKTRYKYGGASDKRKRYFPIQYTPAITIQGRHLQYQLKFGDEVVAHGDLDIDDNSQHEANLEPEFSNEEGLESEEVLSDTLDSNFHNLSLE